MKTTNHRYKGKASVKQSYLNEVSVQCPKCSKEAIVMIVSPWIPQRGRQKCFHCMYSQSTSDLVRYNLVLRRNCDSCGKSIRVSIPNLKQKSEKITHTCSHCGLTRTYDTRNEPYQLVYVSRGKASDPVFRLPLWFQTDMKGNLFWAYNRRHLADIKEYVASLLRERQTNSYTTMVEKLPTFIKQAKNREAILKAIERLEKF